MKKANDNTALAEELGDFSNEDARDAEVAKERLEKIKSDPSSLISGDELQAELEKRIVSDTKKSLFRGGPGESPFAAPPADVPLQVRKPLVD